MTTTKQREQKRKRNRAKRAERRALRAAARPHLDLGQLHRLRSDEDRARTARHQRRTLVGVDWGHQDGDRTVRL